MKIRFFAVALLLSLGIISALQAQTTFTDPIEYNDYIVDHQNAIGRKIIEFNEVMADESVSRESLTPYYNEMISVTRKAVNEVKAMPAFKDYSELRDAAAALFSFYLDIFQNEYVEMLDIIYAEAPSEEDYARVSVIMETIAADEKALDERFGAAQSEFSKAHNFILEENELQEQINPESTDE